MTAKKEQEKSKRPWMAWLHDRMCEKQIHGKTKMTGWAKHPSMLQQLTALAVQLQRYILALQAASAWPP